MAHALPPGVPARKQSDVHHHSHNDHVAPHGPIVGRKAGRKVEGRLSKAGKRR
jgi:hypothetical protein